MPRRGRLKRRLKALRASEDRSRRDLGVLVLDMYRHDELDVEALGGRAAELSTLGAEIDEVALELGESAGGTSSEEEQTRDRLGYPASEPQPADAGESAALEPAQTEPRIEIETEPRIEIETEPRVELERPPAAAPATLDQLRTELEGAEERLAGESERGGDEEGAVAEILALEEDLDREQQRAAEMLERARLQLEAAEQRPAAPADEGEAGGAEARAAAAEWLRGQAGAMRREAERQVREELEERQRGEADRLRAEFDQRLRSETEAARKAGRDQAEAELRPILERADRARIEADRALAEMTSRSNEANSRAQRAEAELAQARRSGLDAEGSRREEQDRRLAEQTEHLREQLKLVREESDHHLREAESARERAAELADRGDALRAERDQARELLRESEERLEQAATPAPATEIETPSSAAAPEPAAAPAGDRLDLNQAGFDELRAAGLSVTQANRVIAYRDRLGGYGSVDDLDKVPGFPRALLAELKDRLQA
jgi:DNA uptake protein ComE-like DNA-binding protein